MPLLADFDIFFPNSNLVTGFVISFFWVARVPMMCGHLMGQMPFKDVEIDGLGRDENGKKMSKSANNGIDPLILIEKYGADAVRYTLIREVAGAGQDISLQYNRATDESESVEASRNFANKLWNAARFVQMNLGGQTPEQLGDPDVDGLELSDRWILSRFYQTVQQTRDYVDTYGLGEAAKGIYEFIWGDFCDWYIELVKPRLRDGADPASQRVAQQTLAYVLEGILKLLHPFMPHVTEEIWHTLTQKTETSLGLMPYPVVDEILIAPTESPVEDEVSPAPEPMAEPIGEDTTEPIAPPAPEPTEFNESTLEQFIHQNQSLLITLGVVALGFVGVKVLFNVLAVINSLPLIGSTFRLIGFLFVIWFVIKRIAPQEQRATTWQIAQHLWNDFFGMIEEQSRRMSTPKPPAPVATEPETTSEPTPEPVAEPVTPTVQTLIDPQLEADFALLIGVIRTIRNLRAEAEIKPGVQVAVRLQSENPDERRVLEAGQDYIANMAKAEQVAIAPTLPENLGQRFGGVFGTVQILIPLQGVVDINELRDKLQKKLAKIEKEISSLQGRLQNQNFVSKAPEDVVAGAQAALAEAQTQAEILRDRLEQLQ
jgi:valyl-tRNA synthetase